MITQLEPETQTVARAEAIATSHEHSAPQRHKAARAVTSPVLSFGRPHDDEFAALPDSEKRAILEHIEVCRRVLREPVMMQGVVREAARAAGRPGMSAERIRKRALAYRRTGDWRVLWDRRRTPAPDTRESLPFPFRRFVAALRTRYQRAGGDAAAIRQLKRMWRAHVAEIDLEIDGRNIKAGQIIPRIPGYATWPEADANTEEPRGWSYDNLTARCTVDEFTTAVLRRGRSAGAEFRPKVGMTRAELKYGQLYYGDDQQFDVHVNYDLSHSGVARRAMRPWGLDFLEALSACHVCNLFKPTLIDDETQMKQHLREVDSLWGWLHVLMKEGYRTDTGTVLAGEHGTATLRKLYAEALARATHDLVQFDAGGSEGAPAFAGMFEGKGGGNPRHKAPLESIRNRLRNDMAALPGPTGLSRDFAPETNVPDKGGQDKYNTALVKAALALPPELREQLQFPFMDWHRFCQLAAYFTRVIDERTDHDLKHWHRCGFVVQSWRTSVTAHDWRPVSEYLALPAEERAVWDRRFLETPQLQGVRSLSPWQVRQALRRDPALKKLSPSVLPEILGLEGRHSRIVTVGKDMVIRIQDREVNPEPMEFHAVVQSRFGGEEWLPRGMEFIAFLDHLCGDLHLFDARANKKGAFIGTCTLSEDAPLGNHDALARACGAVAKIEKEFLTVASRAGGDVARRNIAMRQNNADVLSRAEAGASLTALQKERREQLAAERQAAREDAAGAETAHAALNKLQT